MEKDYMIIATKVSPETYKLLTQLSAKKQITKYELLQLVCEVLVRYMSDKQNLTPDMEKIIQMFEQQDNWSHAFNLCDYTTDKEVTEAVYFLGDKTKKGVAAVHVKTPFFGDWMQDVNVQRIFERVVCLMFPGRYKRLRMLAVDMNCNNLIELVDTLALNQQKEDSLQEIREGFEDAARIDYGTKATDTLYKRKMHRTVDSVNESLQKEIVFDEEDMRAAEEEVERSTFEVPDEARPIGCEEL